MKILVLLCLCIMFIGCEDKQSKQKNTTISTTIAATKPKEKKKDSIVKKREYPLLNDDNVLPFFLKYNKEHKENKVRISTIFGDIDILLFKETRYHRSNFIFLTKQRYFDDTQFYRIVNNFIIQGGSSDETRISKRRRNIGKYLLPIDTKHGFKHHRGIISMPSSDIDNPYKLASPYQFFIVQNPKGAYHLDGDFTAFGKVIKGMNVVDEIASQKTDGSEWPLKNIYIKTIRIID